MGGTEISVQRLLIIKHLNVYGNENKSQIYLHSVWIGLCVVFPKQIMVYFVKIISSLHDKEIKDF
jgi:hypothetical protein